MHCQYGYSAASLDVPQMTHWLQIGALTKCENRDLGQMLARKLHWSEAPAQAAQFHFLCLLGTHSTNSPNRTRASSFMLSPCWYPLSGPTERGAR